MSEKDNLKSKTASLSTDAEKKTTAKTAVKKSAGTAGKAVKAETEKTAEKKTASKKPSTATGKAVKADAETTAEKKTASKKPAASASKTSGTAKKKTATPESTAVRKTSAKKPSAVKQEEIKETSANENEREIRTDEIAAPVAEIKPAEAVKAEDIISEEAKTLQENAVTAEERLVGEAEIASSIDSQLSAILSKPEKRVKRDTGMTQEEIRKAQSEMHETYREMSPLKLVARRFFRSRLSIIGLVMIVALFLFAYLGPVAYNRWGEGEADTTPTTITNIDSFETENGSVEEVYEYTNKINSYAGPSADHLLGTDDKGMDVFTRLMYGGRISLMIGFIVVILETLIGVLLGGLAGYFGGWVDSVIMRIVDVFTQIMKAFLAHNIVVFRPAAVGYPQQFRPVREPVSAVIAVGPVLHDIHGGPVPEGPGVPLQNPGDADTLSPVGGDTFPLRRLQFFLPGIAPRADLVPRLEVLPEGLHGLLAGPASLSSGPDDGFLRQQDAGALPLQLQHQSGEIPVVIGLNLHQGAHHALPILTGR